MFLLTREVRCKHYHSLLTHSSYHYEPLDASSDNSFSSRKSLLSAVCSEKEEKMVRSLLEASRRGSRTRRCQWFLKLIATWLCYAIVRRQ